MNLESPVCLMVRVLSSKQTHVAENSNLFLQSNVIITSKIHIQTYLCILTDRQRRPRDI